MTAPEQAALEHALANLGVPPAKAPSMAVQLDKRARQLATAEGRPHAEALLHLLQLMKDAQDNRHE